jgi:RNA polymerase sigma-70 factor (ECF subfamily)
MHDPDKELVKNMVAGRDRAFRTFFDRFFPRVYRFCTRRLDDTAAEEVTQAVLVIAIRRIETYRGEASLFTWLCQIARHEISAHYRRAARHRDVVPIDENEGIRSELESLAAEPELTPERLAHRGQVQEVVQLILDHLPGDYGRVLELKYMEGYSVDEIAAQLSTTPIAIQSMLARARGAFRKQYAAVADEIADMVSGPGTGSTE